MNANGTPCKLVMNHVYVLKDQINILADLVRHANGLDPFAKDREEIEPLKDLYDRLNDFAHSFYEANSMGDRA